MAKALKIGLVGNGRLGSALASRIQEVGHQLVVHIPSRELLTEDSAVEGLSGMDVDMFILAVPDDAIGKVSLQLGALPRVHCSGAAPLDILGSKPSGVWWPIQTFSGPLEERAWQAIPAMYQGSDPDMTGMLKAFSESMVGRSIPGNDSLRLRLHLGAVFVNNFSNALLGVAENRLTGTGVDLDIYRALWQRTFENAVMQGSKEAQTGPARRGDKGTMLRHKAQLEEGEAELYEALSRFIRDSFDQD